MYQKWGSRVPGTGSSQVFSDCAKLPWGQLLGALPGGDGLDQDGGDGDDLGHGNDLVGDDQ